MCTKNKEKTELPNSMRHVIKKTFSNESIDKLIVAIHEALEPDLLSR